MLSLSAALTVSCVLGTACAGSGGRSQTPAASNPAAANNTSAHTTGDNAKGGAESAQIEMSDDVFKPAQLTVPAGTTVTWVNHGTKAHTVVSNDKTFDSGLVNVGGQFAHTYATPGSYPYHCAPHAKMIGVIVVK
jgi:plastocyanin